MNKKAQSGILIILILVIGFFVLRVYNKSPCGNGICGTGETNTNCPEDCPVNNCGNGVCNSGETIATCPQDCTAPITIPASGPIHYDLSGRDIIFANPSASSKLPVIIVIHGRTQSNGIWFDYSKHQGIFTQKAINLGYAVIAPDSIEPTCPGEKHWAYTTGDTVDLQFFNNIFAWIENNPNLDSSRVYIAGISSGGFMTSRLALNIGTSKIKGVVVHSAGDADYSSITSANNCNTALNQNIPTNIPSTHPKTLLINGINDQLDPVIMGENYYSALTTAGISANIIKVNCGSGTEHLICHDWFNENDYTILNFFEMIAVP